MKLSRRKIVFLTILGVLLVGCLGVVIYYWQAKRAVTVYRQQLIAAGEKLTVKELIPPTPEKEKDGAELFHRARALMNSSSSDLLLTNPPLSMRAVAPGKAAVGWLQPSLRDEMATNTWDDLADTMAGMTRELDLLDQLADKRTIDFKYNYTQGFTGLLPMLAPMKQASQRLSTAVVFALHEDDAEAATAHVRGMLGLVRGLTDERLIISQLVRIAIAQITQAATWELLQFTNTTDAQLETIQREWAALDFVLPAEHSLEMERAISEMTIGDMRESRSEFNRLTSSYGFLGRAGGGGSSSAGNLYEKATDLAKDAWEKTKDASKETAWRVAWSHSDQLRMLKGLQIQIEALRSAHTNQAFSTALSLHRTRLADIGLFKKDENDEGWDILVGGSGLQTMFSSGIPALSKMLHKVMVVEAGKQLTITAIALKRYMLRHGNLPADLAALAPDFLPAIPIDPVNAQPLHYKPNTDGTFLLYSVGEDAEDNGGDPKPDATKTKSNSWQRGRDWVWPQPASAQEIEDYFQQHLQK